MRIFGWCSDGFHAGKEYQYGTPCPGTYRRKHIEMKKRGKKMVKTVLLDEEVTCECSCHTAEDVVDSDKKPRGRKKK